jgi:hypothetical protein
MSKQNKAAAFLANMNIPTQEMSSPAPVSLVKPGRPQKSPGNSRKGLKHIGGYFAAPTVERVALLRARLSLDNSQLIELAIEELYNKHKAKRAFSDM